MCPKHDEYSINDTCFFSIRNRNELRVIKEIRTLLDAPGTPPLTCKDLQDIYALALNCLPPRYTQTGTIVLRDPVHREDITQAVQTALAFVSAQPKI